MRPELGLRGSVLTLRKLGLVVEVELCGMCCTQPVPVPASGHPYRPL